MLRGAQIADKIPQRPQRTASLSGLSRTPSAQKLGAVVKTLERTVPGKHIGSECGCHSRSGPTVQGKRHVPPVQVSPGPGAYNLRSPTLQGGRFTTSERRLLQGWITQDPDGPGPGKYNPQAQCLARSASFGSSPRWAPMTKPQQRTVLERESAPGPAAYRPSYHFLSTFK